MGWRTEAVRVTDVEPLVEKCAGIQLHRRVRLHPDLPAAARHLHLARPVQHHFQLSVERRRGVVDDVHADTVASLVGEGKGDGRERPAQVVPGSLRCARRVDDTPARSRPQVPQKPDEAAPRG